MTTPANVLNVNTLGVVFFANTNQFIPIFQGAAGTVLQSQGPTSIPKWSSLATGFSVINILSQTSAGTFTYTPYSSAGVTMKFCFVEIVAGGGGGGGKGYAGGATSGGGGGEYACGWFTAAQIGANQQYVIGQGGAGGLDSTAANGMPGTASHFGTTPIITVMPGLGSNGQNASGVQLTIGAGGTGGGGGLYHVSGSTGTFAVALSGGQYYAGAGGASYFSGGTSYPITSGTTSTTAVNGIGPGGGGSGGGSPSGGTAGASGGSGAAGAIFITEFCS